MLKDRLLTNASTAARHLLDDDICPRCHQAIETFLHVIRDFPMIINTWFRLVHPQFWNIFFSANLEHWSILNMKRDLSRNNDNQWNKDSGSDLLAGYYGGDRNRAIFEQVVSLILMLLWMWLGELIHSFYLEDLLTPRAVQGCRNEYLCQMNTS